VGDADSDAGKCDADSQQELAMSYKIAQIIQDGDSNTKISHHGEEYKVYTISLASSDSSGVNTCPRALRRSVMQQMLDDGKDVYEIGQWANRRGLSMCSGPCVTWEAGHGQSDFVRAARINLTRWLSENPRTFGAYLRREMDRITRNASDYIIAARANVDSDVNWQKLFPWMFDYGWRFWDYTKCSERLGSVPANYHLTYSYNDGTQAKDWERVYRTGSNIAVVFDTVWNPWGSEFGYLPATWTDPNGKVWQVVDGDRLDLRFLDPQDICVGLRLKASGDKREDACESEFAVPTGIDLVGSVHPAEAEPEYYLAA
jgi:hypothetical protein